ncbi:ATP-dependent DNA helicase MPH1 [Cytospora mali]|uniref:ATP-dependent DNA helicase n=1 Tax=Cytospora mali TaxID=578113 RepID=A0A194VRF0_CYTMA|nr:ATP-dependent DNA helicase MPH1 [Valsa mali]
MDSDDWDDDIADEDLITALTQTSQDQPAAGASTSKVSSGTVPSIFEKSSSARHGSSTVNRISPSAKAPLDPDTVINLDDLDDLLADDFDDSFAQPKTKASPQLPPQSAPLGQAQKVNSAQNFRQVTLWGNALEDKEASQSQVPPRRIYRADLPPEVPTHHSLDHDALKTWVYPTNLGPVRDYQFSIVKNGLFNNTLVALPTGLGKTFIAATVMLNYFRWTNNAKIVFVAPTKPLASQQVEACLNVAGIPRSQATLLTGETSPSLREGEWERRRLFFMTPQTLQNDLSKGYADPKSIALLVIDEAHRATGDYAYVKVVEFIRRFNKSFRVLALTATPGSTVEGVQAVIDSLGISAVEIRTEESIDIRQYVHSRDVRQVVLEPSDEMLRLQDLFSKALKPLCSKISQANKWAARDPMSMTVMGLRASQTTWSLGAGKHANQSTKWMIMSIFSVLQSLAHAIKLLNFHGIAPFYHKLLDFRAETEEKGAKAPKYRRQVLEDENFQEMMDTIDKWQRLEGFVGHPKLSYLCENLLNHFMDAGQGSNTRAIVFSEYRDSAEEIVRALNKHKPMIKASIFVGQADSKRSEGMKQKHQIETIENFKAGKFNVLVATSIGEEGLDIGQVDLIICYDASASPIRMLQRMGRTGRKRAGNITLLLMKGREEEQFRKAKDNYETMQRFICEGTRFNFRNDLSSRIIPRNVKPEVEKRLVEIPFENTQNISLPEPKKGTASRKKATQKKFHMPDGVITGFMKASGFGRPASAGAKSRLKRPLEVETLVEIPDLSTVLLSDSQVDELNYAYRNLPSKHALQEDITGPDLIAHPRAQRKLNPVFKLQHGRYTKRCVKLFRRLAHSQSYTEVDHQPYGEIDQSRFRELSVPAFADESDAEVDGEDVAPFGTHTHKRAHTPVEDEEDSLPKRRKSDPGAKATSRQRSKANPFIDSGGEHDEDSDPFSEEELMSDTFQTFPQRPRTKSNARGRAGISGRNSGTVEDYGDDCTRTSQLYERDDSDSGADLLDFVVNDDVPISSLRDCSTSGSLTSPPPATKGSEKQTQKRPFYEFLAPTQSQTSDDDLLSMSQLGGKKAGKAKDMTSLLSESQGDEDDNIRKRPATTKRRRPVVDDSETE